VRGVVPAPDGAAAPGHCLALSGALGIGRAHLVGHSSSANIALQLALDAPEAVGSVALLEPALQAVPSRAAVAGSVLVPAMERYRAGDRAAAVDIWMTGVCGPGWREVLERALPGAFDQPVADADTFFAQELPAVREWSFGAAEVARVTQPALAVPGGASDRVSPVWGERQAEAPADGLSGLRRGTRAAARTSAATRSPRTARVGAGCRRRAAPAGRPAAGGPARGSRAARCPGCGRARR
jgi:pimeloyl-ACP methyl ester carboxylesterase